LPPNGVSTGESKMNWFKPAPSKEEVDRTASNNGKIDTYGMSSHDKARIDKALNEARNAQKKS
jgi:hypothetical protein